MNRTDKDASPAGAQPTDDRLKKQYLEALEKKNHRATLATDHKDGGPKVSNAHGPADHQKMFRRKSI